MSLFIESLVAFWTSDNDATRVEIIIKGFAFAQEFGSKEDVFTGISLSYSLGITYRNGALDDHDSCGINLHDEFDDLFNMGGIEVILYRVIVCGRSNDYEICIAIGCNCIRSSHKIKWFLAQILLDIFVLYGRLTTVYLFNFLGNDVNCRHMMMLAEQRCNAQPNVTCTCYCYLYTHIWIYFYGSYSLTDYKTALRHASPERPNKRLEWSQAMK